MNALEQAATDRFTTLLETKRSVILDTWVDQFLADWEGTRHGNLPPEEIRAQSQLFLDQLHRLLQNNFSHSWQPQSADPIVQLLTQLSETWAKKGLAAAQSTFYILSFKRILLARYLELESDPAAFSAAVAVLDLVLDRLSLVVVERFEMTRERLIKQQSLSLLELSTPVVKIWDHMILLPLVGVIDTARARKITENLLNSIAEIEAMVTIVDITGVPVLDTAVAGHLMKTINAAQMLGTHVILTGMSPEGAQTLVKLGVSLGDITTRGSLKAGISEGLAALGKVIIDGHRRAG